MERQQKSEGRSDQSTSAPGDGLRVLSDDECVDLLRRHRFGRVALGIDGWPAILPVNYLYDGTSVVIRTAPGAKLDQAPLTAVAFEIDDADRYGHWGWSVLVQGPAFDVTLSIDELSEHLRELPVRPWAPDARDQWLKVAAVRINGRPFGEPQVDERAASGVVPIRVESDPEEHQRAGRLRPRS